MITHTRAWAAQFDVVGIDAAEVRLGVVTLPGWLSVPHREILEGSGRFVARCAARTGVRDR